MDYRSRDQWRTVYAAAEAAEAACVRDEPDRIRVGVEAASISHPWIAEIFLGDGLSVSAFMGPLACFSVSMASDDAAGLSDLLYRTDALHVQNRPYPELTPHMRGVIDALGTAGRRSYFDVVRVHAGRTPTAPDPTELEILTWLFRALPRALRQRPDLVSDFEDERLFPTGSIRTIVFGPDGAWTIEDRPLREMDLPPTDTRDEESTPAWQTAAALPRVAEWHCEIGRMLVATEGGDDPPGAPRSEVLLIITPYDGPSWETAREMRSAAELRNEVALAFADFGVLPLSVHVDDPWLFRDLRPLCLYLRVPLMFVWCTANARSILFEEFAPSLLDFIHGYSIGSPREIAVRVPEADGVRDVNLVRRPSGKFDGDPRGAEMGGDATVTSALELERAAMMNVARLEQAYGERSLSELIASEGRELELARVFPDLEAIPIEAFLRYLPIRTAVAEFHGRDNEVAMLDDIANGMATVWLGEEEE